MKHSKLLFGFITILGFIFLIPFLAGSYLNARDSVSVLSSLGPYLGFRIAICGIALLTVGILGVDWKNVKKSRKRFIALYIFLIPLTTLVCVLIASFMLFMSAPMFPIRSEITQVSVIDTDPLILSVDVKAITSRDSQIEAAIIYNDNETRVAQTDFETSLALAVLPAGSEIKITLNFNTNLTSGNYIVELSSWGSNHCCSTFAIP